MSDKTSKKNKSLDPEAPRKVANARANLLQIRDSEPLDDEQFALRFGYTKRRFHDLLHKNVPFPDHALRFCANQLHITLDQLTSAPEEFARTVLPLHRIRSQAP